MNLGLTKVSNLKIDKSFKIVLTIDYLSFFLYTLEQAAILKNILAGAISCEE